ncbi:holo-ACP synthase [Neomicrococcus lactis]|uniref:Holo-[acyl-carrier-protein] synthase n=1 Tax=Neomicrococcus lactis TaxID=732241 RepID=A0A7W9DA42_9MICC|nr:holo-ACP synthase [Neomicrococcus lactis]MBB5597094.1 holo-[acyl-carrier protein] synthase [Neomicrococcus lactis]
MIVGIGVDVVQVSRFKEQIERTPGLIERLFVPAERGLTVRSLAARFAAKEAVAKALGAPVGMNWQHCQVVKDDAGDPHIMIDGTVAEVAAQKGITTWHLSMSHDGDLATAMVIAEK